MSKNLFRRVRNRLSSQSAMEEGWSYEHPAPTLSPERKRQLMESTTLDTPRSFLHALNTVVSPYWTKAKTSERLLGATLLATALGLTWYTTQLTVDFSGWQNSLINTVQHIFQAMMMARPEIAAEALNHYPILHDAMNQNAILNEVLTKFPDVSSIMDIKAVQDAVAGNKEFQDIIEKNPSVLDIMMYMPGFKEQVAANPEILTQLHQFNAEIGKRLTETPQVSRYLADLTKLSGGHVISNWGTAIKATFNSISHADSIKTLLDETARKAIHDAWHSRDLVTIASKFTATAIISYKSAQLFVLRWQAWTTGYLATKWMQPGVFSRMKSSFANVDNPGQRLQDDPAQFTAGAVSLLTGATSNVLTLAAFSGMLWGMGPLFGVTGGMFWLGTAYAAGLTALTVAAGRKLPWIQRSQQKVDGNFRKALDNIHNNANVIDQNNVHKLEQDITRKSYKPVIVNTSKVITTNVKLIVVDSTIGNLSIPIPWVVGAFAVAAGSASMGTVQTLNYAFNRVASAMSFFVNRFDQLSKMKATTDRMYMQNQASEASLYIQEEKRQIALLLKEPPVQASALEVH